MAMMTAFTDLVMWLIHMRSYFVIAGAGYLFCVRQDFVRAFMAMMTGVVGCALLKCIVDCPWLSGLGLSGMTMPTEQIVAAVAFWGWIAKECGTRECMAAVAVLLGSASWFMLAANKETAAEVVFGWIFAVAVLWVYNWILHNWPRGKEAMYGVALAGITAWMAMCMPAAAKWLWMSAGVLVGGSLGWSWCTSKDRRGCSFTWDTVSHALVAIAGVTLLCGFCGAYGMSMVMRNFVCYAIMAWWITCGHERLWSWKGL